MSNKDRATTLFSRHIALPQEHGAWVFLLSPLLIGLFAGTRFSVSSLLFIIAALAAFLVRQPITIAIKAYSGRRSRRDLPSARFWTVVYTLIGLSALAGLIIQGYGYLLFLALPGIPVFIWHLLLVSRRAERRNIGIEVVGSGVLALSAPGALWVGLEQPDSTGWWLFVLTWLQSAASIVYAYLRLEQRDLSSTPDIKSRLILGKRAILYTSFNFLVVLIFSLAKYLPMLLPLPYLLQWSETLLGSIHPAIGVKPTAIGIRQLIVSTCFTILFILTWRF